MRCAPSSVTGGAWARAVGNGFVDRPKCRKMRATTAGSSRHAMTHMGPSQLPATHEERAVYVDARRLMEWNFVSSSRDQIATAVADWRERRFPLVPGDDAEFIPY